MKNLLPIGLAVLLASFLIILHWNSNHPSEPGEGIKVHGNWTVTVSNKGGEIDEQIKFQNALTEDGAFLLSEHLAGEHSAGRWSIVIPGGLCRQLEEPIECIITTENEMETSENVFQTLQVSTPGSGENSSSIVLEGNFTAAFSEEVSGVATQTFKCPPSTPPLDCLGDTPALFTQKQLESPIEVTEGQVVNINVVISFS